MAYSRWGNGSSMQRLRESEELGPNIDFVIVDLRAISNKTHAGFLFLNEEKNTLRELCRSVGKTAEGKPYSNWKEFAYRLGLKDEDVNHIDFYFKNQEGPVLLTLAAYAQRNDATLEKLIKALRDIDRLDTISLIEDGVRDLVSRVADYPKFIDQTSKIWKPIDLPWVPFVLELPSVGSKSTTNDIDEMIKNATTFLEENRGGIIKSVKNNRPFDARVLLTFANDGVEAADRIANLLRAQKKHIGVLILKELQTHYVVKSQELINDCIEQVDFIIPILTNEYHKTIRGRRSVSYEQIGRFAVDQQYAKYIHSAYTGEFLKDNCHHKRVRCILPHNEKYDPFWGIPEVAIWFREYDIDKVVDLIVSELKSEY